MANNQISKCCEGPISKFTSMISRHWNFSIRVLILKVRSVGNECRPDKM
jgi:hypothetical protein